MNTFTTSHRLIGSSLTTTWAVAVALFGGCYTGQSTFDPLDDDLAGDEVGGAGETPAEEEEEISPTFEPDPAQLRLLNAHEYRNTVRDLLNVEVSAHLDFGEIGSGYDNASEGELGESLFSILHTETERIAIEYVSTGLADDFACFDPGDSADDECIEMIIDDLGRRAFRRPVDSETRQQLLDFVADVEPEVEDSGHLMELLVTRMLMSPRFLYRSEIGQRRSDDPSMNSLDPFERASLISYSLVGSMPDEALLEDAEADLLDLPRIREHVRRLLDTDRGRAQLVKFFAQWLRVEALDSMAQSVENYPKFANAEQARTLRDEFAEFIDRVVVDDEGTLADLLIRNVAYVDRHTAALYGASSQSDELEPLVLDAEQRGGVLTLASVMAVHSSSSEVGRDKPIRRGLLVKKQLLCEFVGLPSGVDVQSEAEEVLEAEPDFEAFTTREQFELITQQAVECQSCHAGFMPYGYLWSNFDALGQYQTHFGARELDSRVEEVQLNGGVASYDGIMQLLPDLAQSEQVSRCFRQHLARYTTGLAEGNVVSFVEGELAAQSIPSDMGILELLEEIFTTPELYTREAQ